MAEDESIKVRGGLFEIGATEHVGANNLAIRKAVIETGDKYPQYIPVQFLKDKCDLLDRYSLGDRVEVKCNLRGKKYQDKYFLNLDAWAIIPVGRTADEHERKKQQQSTSGSTQQAPSSRHNQAPADVELVQEELFEGENKKHGYNPHKEEWQKHQNAGQSEPANQIDSDLPF